MSCLVGGLFGCSARTLLRLRHTTHDLLNVLAATGPGLLLADLAGHLLAHAMEIQSEVLGIKINLVAGALEADNTVVDETNS